MVLSAKVVTYTANTGTGDQTLTGAGFTPKAAIITWNALTNTVNTFVDSAQFGIGWTDGTNQRNVITSTEDAVGTSDTYKVYSDTSLIQTQAVTTGVIDGSADFSSFNSDGMVINWSDAPPAAFKFHVLYLGGADLTNVNVGTMTLDNGTNNQSFSTGFQPDLVMIVGCRNNVEETSTAHAGLQIGAAISSSAQWATGYTSEDGRITSDTWQYYDHDTFLSAIASDTGGVTGTANFVSMDANGFTIDFTEATAVAGVFYYYIALKGGSYHVGFNTEPGGTGNQTINTGKDAKAVMVFGVDTGTEGEPLQANAFFSVGMGDASAVMACNVFEDIDNDTNILSASRYETDSIYLNITANATAGSSTVDDEASLSSVSSTGFVLNWSNIGQARPFRYITFGDAAAAGTAAVAEGERGFGNPYYNSFQGKELSQTIFGY